MMSSPDVRIERSSHWLFGKMPSAGSDITQHRLLTYQQMPDMWKTKWIPKTQLRFSDKQIGSGNFGYVLKGEYNCYGTWMAVAVKQLRVPKDDKEFETNVTNFMKELGLLIRVGENTTSEHASIPGKWGPVLRRHVFLSENKVF
jgi:hypothetical protein